MNHLKLDRALARKRRALRILLISAVGFTFAAVGEGCVGVAGGRPLTIVLVISFFFATGVQWSCYLSLLSSVQTLEVVRDAMEEQSQEEFASKTQPPPTPPSRQCLSPRRPLVHPALATDNWRGSTLIGVVRAATGRRPSGVFARA